MSDTKKLTEEDLKKLKDALDKQEKSLEEREKKIQGQKQNSGEQVELLKTLSTIGVNDIGSLKNLLDQNKQRVASKVAHENSNSNSENFENENSKKENSEKERISKIENELKERKSKEAKVRVHTYIKKIIEENKDDLKTITLYKDNEKFLNSIIQEGAYIHRTTGQDPDLLSLLKEKEQPMLDKITEKAEALGYKKPEEKSEEKAEDSKTEDTKAEAKETKELSQDDIDKLPLEEQLKHFAKEKEEPKTEPKAEVKEEPKEEPTEAKAEETKEEPAPTLKGSNSSASDPNEIKETDDYNQRIEKEMAQSGF